MSVSATSDVPRDVKPMYVAASLLCVLFYLYELCCPVRSRRHTRPTEHGIGWTSHRPDDLKLLHRLRANALAVGLLLVRYEASRILPYATSIVAAGLSTAFAGWRVAC